MNMARKRRRQLSPVQAQEILQNLASCRRAMTRLQAEVAIRSIQYRQARVVITDIDELGFLITGQADYFTDALPSTPDSHGKGAPKTN